MRKIPEFIIQFAGGPKLVLSRLCLALAAIELLVRGLSSLLSAEATLGLKELQVALTSGQVALTSGQMKTSDCVLLMFSIGKLMSLLISDNILNYLDIIVSPYFEELIAICQAATETPQARIRTIFRLNMVSTLFWSLNTDFDDHDRIEDLQNIQPVLVVMQKTMPSLRRIAELSVAELDVLETACSAVKHAIVNLKSSFKPMLQDDMLQAAQTR
uniref:Uncharacterized protein n=1 Tax=Glossina morsitans morsitans TaxID=37546 RepID=A0A1B0FGY5_GLOMM